MDILFGELEYLADYMHVYNGADTTAEALAMDLNGTLDGLSFTSTGCFRLHHPAHHHGRLAVLRQRCRCPHQLRGRLWLRGILGAVRTQLPTTTTPMQRLRDGSCATVDCMGVCGGSAILDEVCGQCLDLGEVIINTDSIQIENGTIEFDLEASFSGLWTSSLLYQSQLRFK